MKLLLLSLCVLATYDLARSDASAKGGHRHRSTLPTTTARPLPPLEQRVKDLEDMMSGYKSTIHGLARQTMLQQFFLEEKVRSDGDSGIKVVRSSKDGTKNYYSGNHITSRYLSVHDHANNDRTAGMGELLVVMNGVEFRTRHNDYKLKMPRTDTSDYNKVMDIPFPDVPPSVLNKPTIDEQVLEMREYFRAFKEQNITHRDYRPYFRANLCYLEGAWTTNTKSLDEPFDSDRHAIDASSWYDLMDKIRYTSITGSKSVLENYALLPTNIMSVDENGNPHYVQWNYRILCHPLKDDLPLKYFVPEDDLSFRFPHRVSMDKVYLSRAQRYHLNREPNDHYSSGRSIYDDLMMQIPGKDNYPSQMFDHSFGMVMEDVRYTNHTLVNTGYYHRYFKTLDKGAMGTKNIRRGFSDSKLWVAQTSHPQVAPISVSDCHTVSNHNKTKVCTSWTNRVSYALPLEVIYMTPLQRWNPYDLPAYPLNVVTGGAKRNGLQDADHAFNGTYNRKMYYRTPSEFYSQGKVEKDSADTAKTGAGVLDKNGQVRIVDSSGIRIVTPNIETVGKIRLRYPIMPVHGEGSGVWKEVNALKDMSMHMNRYASLFEERPGTLVNGTVDEAQLLHYKLSLTVVDPPGEHSHDIFLTKEELEEIQNASHDTRMLFTTSEDMGHTHELDLRWDAKHSRLYIKKCDGLTACWDGHSRFVHEEAY